ncbi:hypothetical protein C8R47DRAFT_1251330 [Mycena vitilis]|nr:hypothetical protein C8R47DRAFT_1251330 [Mycena vitilis]
MTPATASRANYPPYQRMIFRYPNSGLPVARRCQSMAAISLLHLGLFHLVHPPGTLAKFPMPRTSLHAVVPIADFVHDEWSGSNLNMNTPSYPFNAYMYFPQSGQGQGPFPVATSMHTNIVADYIKQVLVPALKLSSAGEWSIPHIPPIDKIAFKDSAGLTSKPIFTWQIKESEGKKILSKLEEIRQEYTYIRVHHTSAPPFKVYVLREHTELWRIMECQEFPDALRDRVDEEAIKVYEKAVLSASEGYNRQQPPTDATDRIYDRAIATAKAALINNCLAKKDEEERALMRSLKAGQPGGRENFNM